MKLMNFSFICAMIFMMGSLDLIHTEPYPEPNLGKPFLVKPRKLQQSNYIVIKYNSNVNFKDNDKEGIIFKVNGKAISPGTTVPSGTKIEIHFSTPRESLSNFFKDNVPNCNQITLIDLSKFDPSNLNTIANIFEGCSSLKVAILSNLRNQKSVTRGTVFSGCNNLRIIDLSGSDILNFFDWSDFQNFKDKISYINLQGTNYKSYSNYIKGALKENSVNIVCGADIGNDNTIHTCCNFNVEEDKCQSSNYMKIYYNGDSFNIENEKLPSQCFAMSGDFIEMCNEYFEQSDNNIVEIYFNSKLKSFTKFFENKKITSVDLSHFDASEVSSIDYMFSSTTIVTIDLSYLSLSKINNLAGLCAYCSNLESVNLSHITNEPINNVTRMFISCNKLKSIDISGLDMSNAASDATSEWAFNVNSLKYINVKGGDLSKNIIAQITNNNKDLTVCQDKPLLVKEGYKYACYKYEDGKEISEVTYSIIVYFTGTENNVFQFNQDGIEAIDYIICGGSAYTKDTITSQITCGSEMLIYLAQTKTLKSLLEGGSNIKSVDLSNLDFSLIESTEKMFKGCSSLESIDLSNINAPSLSNMASMFEGCTGLISVNLNNFTKSKINKMESILTGCSSLKILELSGLIFSSEISSSALFDSFPNLIYLNIKDVEFTEGIKTQFENIISAKTNKIICQNEDLDIKKYEHNEYRCCNIFPLTYKCENVIKVKNGSGGKDIKPFKKEREEVIYIKKGDTLYNPNEAITIEANEEIEIYFSEKITSLKKMFSSETYFDSYHILSIDFSRFNSAFLTDISYLFYSCTGLKSIDFSNFDTSLVTDMSYLFYNCISLNSMDISNFNTKSVTNMNSMFESCLSLTSIDVSNFKTSNVTNMASMFYGCQSIKCLKLQNFDTSSVTDTSQMLSSLRDLVLLDISHFNLQNVTNSNRMLSTQASNLGYLNIYNVENLKDIITTQSDLNYRYQLNVCQKDELITNPTTINTCCYFNITDKKCEDNTTNLFRIIFSSDVEYPNGFGKEYRNDINFIIGDDYYNKISSNEKIRFIARKTYEIYLKPPIQNLENFFNSKEDYDNNTKYIKSIDVILPNSSSVESLESMFEGCSSLESVSFSYTKTSSVTSFASMFRECSSLKSLDLTPLDTSSVEDMSKMFYKCTSLEYIDLSNFDTSKVYTMENMFYNCSSLEYLDLSYFDTSLVNKMNNMFYLCTNLKVLDISYFNMTKIDRASSMFTKLDSLKYINVFNVKDPKNYINGDTYLKKIDNLTICQKDNIIINEKNAYYNCCYYDIQTNKCESYNYMLIYYDNNVTYEKGFSTAKSDTFRTEDYFVINKDYFNKIEKDNKLVIKKGTKLEIYFTSDITSLESYFNVENDPNAVYIKKVDLSHLDFSNIESTSKMLYSCSNLQSVEFYNIETSALKEMDFMFYGCSSLKDVEFSNFNTSLVENMESMFDGCEQIELIDLSFLDTSSVLNMDKMFNGCKFLKYLDISSFDFSSISSIYAIFAGTNNLKYINLYNTKNPLKALKNQEMNNWENPIVCQKEYIIRQSDTIEECCYFNISTSTCDSSNFIIITFGKDTTYQNGFIKDNNGNTIRGNEIDFIINGKHSIKYKPTDKLIIGKGKKIEVYFNSGITSLENYFSATKDPNMENVVSIDLSHFNTSLVTNMASMFNGCSSLKSIDLYDIDTSSVEDMNNMFNDCKALETLELSYLNTSLVTNMAYMFNGCESLIYLDISNFNLENINNFSSVFHGVDNLQYINLYYVKNTYDNITNSDLNDLEGVTVCQKEYLITNENATYNCCYYDIEKQECINDNFVVIYFFENIKYISGFKANNNRKGIDFIVNRYHNSKLSDTDPFNVKKGHKIEVYFSSVKSFESYFDSEKDNNMNYVISMDLSNLKTSSVTNMGKMFYMCTSLKSIDLSNINTSSVTTMYSMFSNCRELESIDLSYFETPILQNMNAMFYNCGKLKILDLSYFNTSEVTNMYWAIRSCISLQLLDISHFNLEKVTRYDGMLENNNNLTYINLNYVKDPKGILAKSHINRSGLTVCQKENIINKSTDNRCCYYNITSQECENQNYITIFFGDRTIYNTGFENSEDNTKFRLGMDFIINGEDHNKKLIGTDKIYLHRGSKLEIYFSNDTLSLQNYFNADKDTNMKNLVSIYLSNLNTTISNNLDYMFYGCESLKTVFDLNDIKTLPIVNMSYMFYNCTSLEFLDLSAFNTSSVQDMISTFEKCKSLKYLDISHFNLGNIKGNSNIKNIFRDIENLKYINVYNIQDPNKLLFDYKYQNKFFTKIPIVCQKEDYKIISHDNIISKCCYYNMSSEECNDSNFITLYYGEDVEYSSYGNDCRKGTFNYVINNDHNIKLYSSSHIMIKKGHKFEIYFSSPLESLEDYFSPSCDPNMKYIVSVDLSNLDTSKLTNMKSAFADCELLESVDFYNFKGSSIINMNSLFSNCPLLKSIDFSYLDPSSVAYMNNMFSECTSLESVTFSSSETKSLVNLKEMFKGCSSLLSIDISGFITTSTTIMDYMFSGCTSLKYLDISNFNMEQVTNADSMFENVESLKYINLFKAIDYNDYISKSELNNLDNLTVCQSEQILTKGDVINRCCKYNITTEQCDYTNYIELYYGEDVSYVKDFKNCSRKDIDYIMIGNKIINYTEDINFDIGKNTKVEIHFKNKLESLSNFFCSEDENTENIISIDLSYIDTSELKDISSMFSGCSSLKSINIIYFNTSSVINMSSLFEGCTQLESIDLSNFDTSLVKDMSMMFNGCNNLTSIDVSSFDTSSVTDMSSMFSDCSSIKLLDLSNFNTSQVTNFKSIFSGCINLKVLDISHFEIGEKSTTNKKMLNDIKNLRYINLYYAEDNTNNKYLNLSVSGIENISVCQNINEKVVEYENIIERCCYYNILTDKCENSNYIVVKYRQSDEGTISYYNGFEHSDMEPENVREGKIDFIIYKNKKYNVTEELNIESGSEIEIYLKKNVTSLESFFDKNYDWNVEYIESIDFSHLDTSNITSLTSLFNECEYLLNIDFSNCNTSSLNKMDYMFYGCESITSINLTNFNTSLVTDMNSLFYNCGKLQYVYLSNLNTSKVENMAHMFSDCKSLVSIDLSYFNTSSLTNMNYMFSGCESLKVLDISHFNLDNVTNSEKMQGIFSNVKTLRYINLYYVEDNNKAIKDEDFSSLNNLIICEKEDILRTDINERERRCCYFNITKDACEYDNYIIIYYKKESNYNKGFINKYRNGVSFIIKDDYINTLTNNQSFKVNAGWKIELHFNSQITSLESFFDSEHDINIVNIKSIDLSFFKPISLIDMSKTFSGCTSLESITFNTLSLKNMTNMFSKCYSLKSIDLTPLNVDKVTDMSYMFYECTSLESIDFNLDLIDNSLVTDMSYMFYGCNSLKSIDLTFLDVSKVTDMSYMFYGCSSLKSFNTTNFNIYAVTKMNSMFYNCSSLESIDFSLYQTSPLTDLEQMFYGCENITSLNLSKFNTSLVTNMKEIFYGCNKLAYLDLSNFDMGKCEDYSNMFSDIKNMIYINIFNYTNDKIISEVFKNTDNIIFVCQSQDIIKNKKAYNCCEFNFEYNECQNIPTTIVTTFIKENTFITPQSTLLTDKSFSTEEELMTTYFSEKIVKEDSTFAEEIKETTGEISKTTYIPEETQSFTDYRSTILNIPTTNIVPDSTQIESSLLEKADSTFNQVKDTTNSFDTLFKTSNIETTHIDLPTTNPSTYITSSIKESIVDTHKSSTQSVSSNIPSTDITNIDKSTSFNDISTSLIKETTEKTSNLVPSTSTEKENIPTTSLHKITTEIPTTTFSSNIDSTYKEEVKTTAATQEKEVVTTNLETTFQTTHESSDTTQTTTSNIDTTQANSEHIVESTTLSTNSKLDGTSNLPTTSKDEVEPKTSEPIVEPTTSEHEKLEPTTSEPETVSTTSKHEVEPTTSKNQEESTTMKSEVESTTLEPEAEPTTSEAEKQSSSRSELESTTLKSEIESTTHEPEEKEPTTSEMEKEESTTSKSEVEPTTSKPEIATSSELEIKPTTSKSEVEPTTSKPEIATSSELEIKPTTSKSEVESTTSKPEKIESTTTESELESTTSEYEVESTTSKPEKLQSTTPEPEVELSTSKPEPTTSKLEITTSKTEVEPTTSEPEKLETTTLEPEIKPTTSKTEVEPTTSEHEKIEPTTSETEKQTTSQPEKLATTSESEKQESTTEKPEIEPSTSKPEPTTSEMKTTQYSIETTSINKEKTEVIPTTIINHINLTSIASTATKIPTTIVENIIKTTVITDYGMASVILVGFSNFLTFITYFTFYIHFRSVRGHIFSHSMTMNVNLVNNRILRILQSHQANCEKVNEDLENANYLCNVVADVSTISTIKIEPEFNFTSQDIKVVGITPVAYSLMENIQNATGEYDNLLQTNYYILDHCNITAYKDNNTFDIIGVIDEPKPSFGNIDLALKINVEKKKEIIEADLNCTIVNINGSNYTLNCFGEKNTLYNLQSAVSFIDNDVLLINFDENVTSEIIFSSNSYRYRNKDTNGISAGAIVAIVLSIIAILVALFIFIFLFRKDKLAKDNTQESTVANLKV